jgi:hypothetical protein
MLGTALLASIAVMASAGPASAHTCPQPKPPPFTRIQGYMEERAELGLRSDAAYVRRLIRRGVWEYDVGDIPVTPAENRYLRRRDWLSQMTGPIDRYLARHRGLSGGVSIEDAFPHPAYLLVRVTRHRALHARRLARLAPHVRTVLVGHSVRELRAVEGRVDASPPPSADGVVVDGTGVDIDAGTVDVDVITARTDATAYLRARYGPLVTAHVIAATLTSPRCAHMVGYRSTDAGLELVYETDGVSTFDHAEVTESDERVEVAVVEQVPNGAIAGVGATGRQAVTLSRPLGGRRVVDANTGKPLRVFPP